MKSKLMATVTAGAACAAGAAGVMIPAVAAAAVPGDNCQVNSGRAWQVLINGSVAYTVSYPSHVVIDGYNGPDTYFAHGNGKPTGVLVRAAVNQSTCV